MESCIVQQTLEPVFYFSNSWVCWGHRNGWAVPLPEVGDTAGQEAASNQWLILVKRQKNAQEFQTGSASGFADSIKLFPRESPHIWEQTEPETVRPCNLALRGKEHQPNGKDITAGPHLLRWCASDSVWFQLLPPSVIT